MLTNSKDVLFIALSASALVLTFFLAWSLYYIAVSLRDVRNVIGGVKKRIDSLFAFIEHIKEKTESTATATTAISKAVIDVVKYVKEKKEKKEGTQEEE